ncbi:hypothetical protein SAMN05216235_2310 [Salinicoccus halodurans]|uniref:Uncharacterized protein n=2 Tax=Salinicoccus halodurans TaxID=407035 RepID=A0AA94HJE7_9STAP|nr:hypothetical protein SAMN05216235_2310 [Salinicoccus halodurans]
MFKVPDLNDKLKTHNFSHKEGIQMPKTRNDPELTASVIPLGMIFGTLVGVIISLIINPDIVMYALVAGASLGLNIGTVIYAALHHNKGENS